MKPVILLILFAVSTFAQGESILKLFPGKWKMISEKTEYYEEWKMVDSSELVGKEYSIEVGVVTESETIYLKKFADTWAYVAIQKSGNYSFALNDFTQNKFIFENERLSQRVIYEFKNVYQCKIEGN
jgi:hypothetical protein